MRTRALGCIGLLLLACACGSSSNGGDAGSSTDASGTYRDGSASDAGTHKDGSVHDAHATKDGSNVDLDGALVDGGGKDGALDGRPPAPALPALPAGTGTGKTYYVSPSGSDTNTGLGQTAALAWKTLANLSSRPFGPGDTVLLEGGQSFTGCVSLAPSKVTSTAAAPFTIASYGTGNATLTASCSGQQAAAVAMNGVSGVYLHDLVIRGNEGDAQYGVFVVNTYSTTVPITWIRVESCDISGFYSNDTKVYGGEVFIAGTPGPIQQVYILDNVLHGSAGPTSRDDNGITGYGFQTISDVLYQGNEVYDIGSNQPGIFPGSQGNCILAIGLNGGVVQYNVAHACGGNTTTCGGPAGIWAYGSNNVVIQYNESYGTKAAGAKPTGACDWNGYDLDGLVTNSTLQYNWSHDNYGTGYLTFINGTWSGNTIRYNISQNDGQSIFLGGAAGVTSDIAVYGNTVYSDLDAGTSFGLGIADDGSVGGKVFDNVFMRAGNGDLVDIVPWNTAKYTGLELLGNDYYAPKAFDIYWGGKTYTTLDTWTTASGEETKGGTVVGQAVDPKLTAPGTVGIVGGYDPGALAAYRLQAGSPMVGVGQAPGASFGIDGGSHDYFGGAIPGTQGTGYNIGADGKQ